MENSLDEIVKVMETTFEMFLLEVRPLDKKTESELRVNHRKTVEQVKKDYVSFEESVKKHHDNFTSKYGKILGLCTKAIPRIIGELGESLIQKGEDESLVNSFEKRGDRISDAMASALKQLHQLRNKEEAELQQEIERLINNVKEYQDRDKNILFRDYLRQVGEIDPSQN